jgi:transposase
MEVMVVNPRAIKHFATAILQRGKTDSLDAGTILEYLERMPFNAWCPPAEEVLEIQHISRRIVALNNELVRERNRLGAAKRLGSWGRKVVRDIEVNIRHLERRIAHLETAVRACIESVSQLASKLELLESATGIARKTGPRILAELETLPDDMTGPQWVAHAGLDPRPYDSGTSTHRPRRISKNGNRYLRDALFFPAMVASQKDPHVSAYYQMLIARGKKPMQAIVAIMRKLLLAIWGMFKNNESWDGNKFYRRA